MRNGMSVEEVYAKLDRLEELEKEHAGLATDYMKLIDIFEDLANDICKATFYLDHLTTVYSNVAASPEATEEDKLEFAGKISGLREAKTYLIRILEKHAKSEEEQNDLSGDAEGNESTV